MPYGNETAPEGAPVAPKDLIGAALLLGLVSVVAISVEGAYLVRLLTDLLEGTAKADVNAIRLLDILVNVAGFVGSLWLLALRRWAWRLSLAFAATRVGVHVFLLIRALGGGPDLVGAVINLLLALLFIVVLGFLLGEEVGALVEKREAYRRAMVSQAGA